jgi:SagB-type dehydrogenase family enzyme
LPPSPAPTAIDRSRLIARRRSIRRFSAAALPLADLSGCLAATTLAVPTFTRALRLDIVVERVAGLAAGAFHYDAARHALVPTRPGHAGLRTATRGAGLDQDVIGDAAVVLVVSVDRRVIASDPLGAGRGYRHGFLEAGLVGERIYLDAVARRLGACSVGAFYDDEAAALVGIDPSREWVVHLVALGLPRPEAAAGAGQSSLRSDGNRMTSRMLGESVSSITSRSMPMPQPPVGGMPISRAWMKSAS